MAAQESCPQCGEPVGRFDYQCPNCELLLPNRDARTSKREVSVVRAMIEKPGAARGKRPRPPTGVTLGGERALVPLDRVVKVVAQLRLEKLNLHPYDAWVVSLIDGRSTGEQLAKKLALAPRELQGVLESLIDRGVLSLGPVRTAPKLADAGGDDDDENLPTKLMAKPDLAALGLEKPSQRKTELELATEAHLPTPSPRPPPARPAGRASTTSPRRDPSRRDIGEDEDESTLSATPADEPPARAVRPAPAPPPPPPRPPAKASNVQRRVPTPQPVPQETVLTAQRPAPSTGPKLRLPMPQDEDLSPVPQETVLVDKRRAPEPATEDEPADDQVRQETVLLGRDGKPRNPRGSSPGRPPVEADAEQHRPQSDPQYRPPRPASPSREVPRPTLGIEDVDAKGALQVALQMEQTGRMEEAVGYLERAIERSPDAAPLYNRLAIILMRDFNDLARAEELVKRAIQLAPEQSVFRRNLETVLQRKRQSKKRR